MGPKGPRAAQNSPSCESAGKGCAEVAFVRAGFEDGDGRVRRFMQTACSHLGFRAQKIHCIFEVSSNRGKQARTKVTFAQSPPASSHEGHFCAWEAWRAACRSAALWRLRSSRAMWRSMQASAAEKRHPQ